MKNHFKTIIVGGGTSGLVLGNKLDDALIIERNDRVGKKLSATGNGQGNLSNAQMDETHYFSSEPSSIERIKSALERYGKEHFIGFLSSLGGLTVEDNRGRIYPAGKQASSLTDLLRYALKKRGTEVLTDTRVLKIEKLPVGFSLLTDTNGVFTADFVCLCVGGKCAKQFGTDGTSYALAEAFSHTVTALSPSLVQLKTATEDIKGLRGVRLDGAKVWLEKDEKTVAELFGDVIFTDYGVSGDAVFRISAFLGREGNYRLHIDALPSFTVDDLKEILSKKEQAGFPSEELLCSVVQNAFGRAVQKKAKREQKPCETVLKDFVLPVIGTLGFDYAQVTKGGVLLSETDENLQSKKADGLYFAGEVLDVDGECGGYNLQWAYTSACVVANAINQR